MKNQKTISSRPLVQLELPLQQQAGDLNASESRALAGKLERWAHQLRVKAAVLDAHFSRPSLPRLKRLPLSRLILN